MTTLAASPRYAKFFRMLRVGLPEGAVRQLLCAHGLDERVLSLGPDALERDVLPATATATPTPTPSGPAADARVYHTSLRMLLVGVPSGAVEQALRVRTLDTRVYEQTLGRLRATLAQRHAPLASATTTVASVPLDQENATAAMMTRARATATPWTTLFATVMDPNDTTPLRDHAPLRRFFTMRRAGVAVGAVENALAAAGLPRELAHWDPTLPVGTTLAEPLV